jgi:hypothetical protein
LFFQAWQASQCKSFAPLAHDLARSVEARRDDIIG